MPHTAALQKYAQDNKTVYDSKPLRKSKYTSVSKLDALLTEGGGKSPQVMVKISPQEAGEVFTLDEFMAKNKGVVEKILAKEEKPKDQYEAFINSHYNCGFVVVLGKRAAGKLIMIQTTLSGGACAKGIIIIEEGVETSILEKISSNEKLMLNQTMHIRQGARVCVANTVHANFEQVLYRQQIAEKDATLESSAAFITGSLVRANTANILQGSGASVKDYSFLLTAQKQHTDINYSSVHRATDGFSHCIIKSVLKDESRNVFDGMIKIEEGADRSNALLECHSMILGEKASSNQIPSLEIKTDDVKATHSATVTKIEEDELFYLGARGISREEARKMIVKSFLESIVFMLPESVRQPLFSEIEVNA